MNTSSCIERFFAIVLFLVVALSAPFPAAAETLVVHDGWGNYDSIQEAIDRAEPGDTVLVKEGTYEVNLRIDKDLTLKGAGSSKTKINRIKRGYPILWVGSSRIEVIVEDITLKGAEGEDCKDRDKGLCPNGLSVTGESKVTLRKSTITDNGGVGIWLSGLDRATLRGNSIKENGIGVKIFRPEGFEGALEGFGNEVTNNNTDFKNVPYSTRKELTAERKAELTIKITDQLGNDLDARIYLDGDYETRTGGDGRYRLDGLSPGNYAVRAEREGYNSANVSVSLSAGEREEIVLSLEGKNETPSASFTFSPTSPKTGEKLRFDDSRSGDPDGAIEEYRWTFGDGNSSFSESPTHKYFEPGTYTVKLKVTDDEGGTDTITKEVIIQNRKPTSTFTYSPEEPQVNQQVTFDATSSADPDGKVTGYRWDLTGDGSYDKSGSEVTRTYEKQASLEVKLIVTDDQGATSSATEKIEITKPTKPQEGVKIEDKYALVVGIADYRHETIRDLKYPARDAKDFYQFLVDEDYGSFPEDNVALLTNKEATTEKISKEMGELVMEVDEKDLVIIYYSGHGTLGPDKNDDEEDGYDEYYVTYDTDTSSGAKLYSTGISDDRFGNWLGSMDSKRVAIFLDSCYSGGATKASKGTSVPGQKTIPKNEVFNDFSFEDRLLFAASRENQPSWESPQLNQGVFTHFLLEGFKGKADHNGDGKVTSEELYDYIRPNVSSYVDEHFTSTQTPLMKGAIDVPLAEKKEKLEGEVKYVKQAGREEAGKGEYVVINLGSEDGVKADDVFKVFLTAKGVGIFEKVYTKIEITKVAGPHLAVGKVRGSDLTVEKGYKVEKAKGG